MGLGIQLNSMSPCRKAVLVPVLTALVCLLAWPAAAQRAAKRLILKDGSYQMATEWQIKGERVRYYSAERSEWEEVPKSMVDWEATEKWAKERSERKLDEETRAVAAELEAERKEREARTPMVAPGVQLPATGGVFLLDYFQGQPQAVELVQSGSEVEKNTGKNILRAAINPFASAKQSIVLKGLRARVQSHTLNPTLYVNVEPDDALAEEPDEPRVTDAQRFRIVRMKRKKNNREVGNLKIALTGRVKQEQTFLEATAQPMGGGWVKIVPEQPVAAGEYAIVEMLTEKEMNLYVWDFGVDPNAPANPTAWKPEPAKQTRTGTDKSPVLTDRKD